MELILNILFIYVAVYSLYFLVLAVRSLINDKAGKTKFEHALTSYEEVKENNLCVVIYTHNNVKALERLQRQLKMQSYEKFFPYIILDNCNDGSYDAIDHSMHTRVLNLTEGSLIGKDQSLMILQEKLLEDNKFDAYVFLDVNRNISEHYLFNVNKALNKNVAITGPLTILSNSDSLKDRVFATFNTYKNKFLFKTRASLGLANVLDGGNFVIYKKLLDAIQFISIEGTDEELKYSLLLAKNGYHCILDESLETCIETEEIYIKRYSVSSRIKLFLNCFKSLFGKNIVYNEFACSMILPNIWFVLVVYALVLKISFNFYFFIDFIYVLSIFLLFAIAFFISLVGAKFSFNEFKYLTLYPLLSISHLIYNFPLIRFFVRLFSKDKKNNSKVEKHVVDVMVTNGEREIPCKLEIISDNGLPKVIFKFKKKKFVTDKHLRVIEALEELVMKLADYGFTLKICQVCESFSPNVDGTQNMIRGFCKKANDAETILWNSCPYFSIRNAQSLVDDIKEYLKEINS